jgi:hypothetical protein
VTASLSWAAEPRAVSFAEVDDNLGNFLFSLNVGPPPRTTGSINPNPQTVSGLPSSTMAVVTNGQVGVFVNSFATLDLLDANHQLIDSTLFIADVPGAIPEPASWSLAGMGLGLAVLYARKLRRNA